MINIDFDKKLCYINDEPVELTKTEFNMLGFLFTNKNKIFSRKEIIENVWTKKVTNRAVDVNIIRLRKKLREDGKYIKTRVGFGYGFIEKGD